MSDWLNVSDTAPRIAYTATASQTLFTVPFVFFEDADLLVYQNTVLLTLATNYTVSGAEDEDGGTVTLLTGAALGDEIMIVRDIEIVQTTHIPPSGPLDIPALNIQFSKLIAIDQQLRNALARAIHFPDSDSTLSGELAPVATRKNFLLGFDTNGELSYVLGPSFVAGTAVGVVEIDSTATAQVTTIDVSSNIINTYGLTTPGDGGGGTYSRVGSQPASGSYFQSADGAWWLLVGGGSGGTGSGTDITTHADAVASTIGSSTTFVRTSGYTTAGDGGAALYKKVVAQPTHPGKFQSADGAWWEIAEAVIDPRMLGAKFDDSTDDGTAINNAIGVDRPVSFPKGTARSSIDIVANKGNNITGAGPTASIIKFTGTGGSFVLSYAGNMVAEGFGVVTTQAAASRTVAGVKITGGASICCRSINSTGHKYGFWVTGAGNEFERCFTVSNASHGFYYDASVSGTMNETNTTNCQSNGNGGNGFHTVANGVTQTAGMWFYRPTAASNTGHGMAFVNGANDVYVTAPEMSGNLGVNIDLSSNGPSASFTLCGGLIESSTLQAVWIGQNCVGTAITGATVTCGAQSGIIDDGISSTITGNVFGGAFAAGGAIELGAHSTKAVMTGNSQSTELGGAITVRGILVDAAAGPFTAIGNDFSAATNPISGVAPAGSVVLGNKGIATTQLTNGWSGSADAAVNGFITIVDSGGTSRKLATVA